MRRSRRRGRRCAHGRRVGERRSPSRWDGEDGWLWLRVKKAAAYGQRERNSVPCHTASCFVARSLKLRGTNLNLYDNVQTADPNKLIVQQRQSIVTDANATYRLHLFLAGGRVQVDNRQATQQAMDEVSKILRAWIGSPPPRTLVH